VLRPDLRLLVAVAAPLLIWPWLSAWRYAGSLSVTDVLLLTLVTPVAEEVLFRGFLQGGLLRMVPFKRLFIGLSAANWTTSVLFAASHAWQHPLSLLPGYFLVSLVFGHFRERYHGLTVPILLHGYYNLGLLLSAG
jgi:membrane protease YdiL (CAAX protease family)